MVLVPVLLIALYAAANFMAYADSEAPYYVWNREVTTSVQDGPVDVMILGDSAANAAFMPELLSESTVNLALGGTTPLENYYVFTEWLAHNAPPKDLFIAFSDLHMRKANCFWERTMYSHRFTPSENYRMIREAAKYHDETIAHRGWPADYLAYELYMPGKYITSLTAAGFNKRLEDNRFYKEEIEVCGGRYIARGNTEWAAEAQTLDEYVVSDLMDCYYRRIIDLAITNGCRVHVIKLPSPNCVFTAYTYIEQCNAYYDGLKESYPDITVDWWGAYEPFRFFDDVHMNTHGARLFSTELRAKYQECFTASGDSSESVAVNALSESTASNDSSESVAVAVSANFGAQGGRSLVARNNDISAENYKEEMVYWIDGQDYSLVVMDPTGEMGEVFSTSIAVLQDLDMKSYAQNSVYIAPPHAVARGLDIDGMAVPGAYIIDGFEGASENFAVTFDGQSVTIMCPDGSSELLDMYGEYTLSMCVVDNCSGKILCRKDF